MRYITFLLLQLTVFTVFAQENKTLKWQNYDFISGTEIIFEDNQQGEQNGEFPSKWDLVGGVVENANLENENIIMFLQMGAFLNKMGIVPLIKNPPTFVRYIFLCNFVIVMRQ